MDTKRWFQSKTIWGGAAAIVAGILKGRNIEISDLLPSLLNNIDAVLAFVGGAVAIYGRIRASALIAPKATATKIAGLIVIGSLLIVGLPGCAQGPVYTTSAAARIATDVEVAAAEAMQAYASYKSGNVDMLWSLSKGVSAYSQIVQTASDVKLLAKAWTGNTGDSQKLADKLARIFAQSPAPPEQKAVAIANAAQAVAANTAP